MFIQEFIRRGDISFLGMRNTAMSLLPNDRTVLDKLKEDLKRGTGILDDDIHLNMYLRSFGKMHKAKLDDAFQCLPNFADIFSEEVEIFDWGCGQGTASICLLDFLKDENIEHHITKINLIEPSALATRRAKAVIECFDQNIQVNIINEVFDNLSDFEHSCSKKVHLFSNILDIDAFDLAKFTGLFQRSFFCSYNYFICVGPYYSNNRRVDEFIAAMDPTEVYATYNKERGMWKEEWTISLRVFFNDFTRVDTIDNIRKRIEDSHKKDQFFAGYVLDSVTEEFERYDIKDEVECLFNSLSSFDVKSNKNLDAQPHMNSKVAVLANIVSRGLPTKAPIFVEDIFSEKFDLSEKPEEGAIITYKSKHIISVTEINEALHIVDPRFNIDSYNGDMLESEFEKSFIERYIASTDSQYLIQLLEPQRPLSSIVSIPDERFCKDQRVDFSIEVPYGESKIGFVFELDGAPYHSNIFQKLNDERRDRMVFGNGWDTYRLEHLRDYSFLNSWEQEASANKYLTIIKRNYKKKISAKWKDTLQIVLSPLAIARVERMMLQAMMSGTPDIKSKKWNIVVVERDVPCAAMAIHLLKESYEKISALDGSKEKLPDIDLTIVSTEEFKDSKLHLGQKIASYIPDKSFDICIDISMLLRDNIDALPLNVNAESVYIIRSSHYKKKERVICSAENIIYPAFVTKDTTGKYVEISEREDLLTYFLQNIFRKPNFRPGQLPILNHSLSDKTTIGLLPTGGGKSLVYQLSSMLQPGVTIVVDPLVSLMVDQVRGLHELRIDASDCVNSGMDAIQRAKKLNLLQNGSLQFMLLSPERYMMKNFRDRLISMTQRNHIYFAYGVIDEVHCVSEWGHDFRPSYLHLGRNMINFMSTKSGRPLSIIGLTATASFDVLADVERELTLGGNLTIDSETIVRPENDSRPELNYRIINVEADYDSLRDNNNRYLLTAGSEWDLKDIVSSSKKARLYDLLQEIPNDIIEINSSSSSPTSCHIDTFNTENFYQEDENSKYNNAGIIFCPHAHGTFGVLNTVGGNSPGIASELAAHYNDSLNIGTFVGGDNPSEDMRRFNDNEQNVMVATKAFGMGIDKPNVRFTINFNHPSSLESFVQEAGRAGRDKKHAISYILYDSTEYINLSIDKVNDIRVAIINAYGKDPNWLEKYANKFILRSDLIPFCLEYDTEDVAKSIFVFCKENGYFENIDKGITLWFHNNSFRGLYKEKVILYEMTDRILNIRPTFLLEIQERLINETGNSDLLLHLDNARNAVKILSMDNPRNQYGYIFLDNLTPSYRYVDFDDNLCRYICQSLIEILSTYEDHSARALLRPLEGPDNAAEGIYSAMARADANGYVYVTVSWENSIMMDWEGFENAIKTEITAIANLEDESIRKNQWNNINENYYGRLILNKVADFDELIAQISKCSNDARWLRFHAFSDLYKNLKRIFCQKRDKDDTDKAIYRMCCIGLVEDVTIDYLSHTYELKIRNRSDEEFKQYMLDFFRKYYSLEQASKKVSEIEQQQGRNYLDKCLGYLTAFVYENLEKKRYRAIEDMRIACEDSIKHREADHNDEWLKEFIHLYFNSKYARQDYEVNGKNYSLSKDTDEFGREDFDVVLKYIDIMMKDNSGSEVENVKHLYGATLLCLRAHPDNPALKLLLTYCISILGTGTNETLKRDALNGYIEAFMTIYKREDTAVWKYIEKFNELLTLKAKEGFIIENIVKNGKSTIVLLIHEEKFNKFTKHYII